MQKYVTRQELVEVIKSVKGSTFVSYVAETEVDMNKTGNPFYGATKVNTVAAQIGFDYEVAVNNQLGREDKPLDFVQQAHKWAVATDSRNLVMNEALTKLYLRAKVMSAATPMYFFDGQPVSKETIAPWLKPHRKPNTQSNLVKEVPVRNVTMSNIYSMKLLGDEYIVTETLEQYNRAIAVIEEVVEAVTETVTAVETENA